MDIFVNSIQKNNKDFLDEINEYIKMSKKFASIKDNVIFNDKIAKAQSSSKIEALKSYDEAFSPFVNGYCIALDERGDSLDSFEFAKILSKNSQISFFIGGAYGLSDEFKSKTHKCISLSKMTYAHKIAKLVLFEQIFRGLCINSNHPYHK